MVEVKFPKFGYQIYPTLWTDRRPCIINYMYIQLDILKDPLARTLDSPCRRSEGRAGVNYSLSDL